MVIENASQLDVGHCAAACWMGDIYALLNRKIEAILAYSIAARTPLAEDPVWVPLQQQLLLERAACRSGDVKTGVNLSMSHDPRDDDKAADSILNLRVIARDVARTIMQADNQPGSREACRLDPNRSRAMVLHDSGIVSGSWQEKCKLEIDATIFEACQPWPLPLTHSSFWRMLDGTAYRRRRATCCGVVCQRPGSQRRVAWHSVVRTCGG